MIAGRQLDSLIHERVMGRDMTKPPGFKYPMGLPRYSTDIAAAWEVVEKMVPRVEVGTFSLTGGWETGWSARFWQPYEGENSPAYNASAEAATAPLAICLSALAAVTAAEA